MRTRRSLLILLALIYTACAGVPQTHRYLLEPRHTTISPETGVPKGFEIGVRTFRVDPPYDQDRIVYRVGEDNPEVGFYAYHRWAAPLSRMLPSCVAGELGGTPGIARIEPAAADHSYDAYLEGRLLSLEEIDAADGYRARVRLELTLRAPGGGLLWSDTLEGDAVTQTDTVPAVVEQFRIALNEAVAGSRDGLASAIAAAGD